jgi:hypothetical protein
MIGPGLMVLTRMPRGVSSPVRCKARRSEGLRRSPGLLSQCLSQRSRQQASHETPDTRHRTPRGALKRALSLEMDLPPRLPGVSVDYRNLVYYSP